MKRLFLGGGALAAAAVMAFLPAGCGNDSTKDVFVASFDAGSDAAADATADGGGGDGGIDPTLGGPCNDDAQCDDAIACTADRCDQTISRCRSTPDDTKCDDGVYCNGPERCIARQGCGPGPVVTCEDGNGCTIDTCVEASKSCINAPRDADGDGDPDGHCPGGGDCDDTNPNVNSKHAEVCSNLIDDNCNGQIDEQPCTVPTNDTCATAEVVTASSSLLLSTVATKQDYATSCATSTSGAQDIVVAITVPAGGPQDIVVRARGSQAETVGLTLESTCGTSSSELQCEQIANVNDVRAIARSVAGGRTVFAIVTTQHESPVDLDVSFLPPTTKPTNEDCSSPTPIALNTPVAVSLIDAKRDLDSSCPSTIGDLTYSFTIEDSSDDVKIFATPTFGSADPIVSLRDPACIAQDDEITCHQGSTTPLFRRSLAAGTYILAVSSVGQIDASILVQTSPATTEPPDETCATAPDATANVAYAVDLSNHQNSVDVGCFAASNPLFGDPTSLRTLTLGEASDVLLVGRFAQNEIGGIALSDVSCKAADTSSNYCGYGSTPARISNHDLAAGTYHVLVTDQLGENVTVTPLVRPTVATTNVVGTADDCSSVVTIPSTGGFFQGDTASAHADFDAGCDQGGQPAGSAKDQLLKLVLPTRQRVVFDMTHSTLQTLLDIRTGDSCPGVEVAGGCETPNGSSSFLDIDLDPGTYYVQIDGYAGSTGAWFLDVRVLDPD